MRKATSFVVAAVMSLLTLSLPAPAQAHNWIGYGPGFRIGGIELSIFFGQPSYSRYRDYYYRSARPFNYRGHRCSDACFRDGGYYYHHESCPLVAEHFHHYGVRRDQIFERYAPRYDRHDGYGRYDRYDRRDGYDRHDRYDRDRYGRHSDRYDRDGYRDRDRRYDRDRYGRDRRHDRGRYDDHDRDRDRYHRNH